MYILSYKKMKDEGSTILPPEPIVPEIPELSDLVTLGILPKYVSEFTNADIGTIVSIPYTDASGNITGPIEFEVVGVNHHKDIHDESKPTITLMSKNVLRYAAFDGKEPTNPLFDDWENANARADYGNNRWAVSNIRQWLNSNGAANEWFTPQHEYDEAPTYTDAPGFLAGFSDEVKQHFAIVRNKTLLCDADRSTLSKDFEETEDKVFLPSYTEMGFGNLDDNNPEGTWLSNKFIDDESIIKTKSSKDASYWLRSLYINYSYYVYKINQIRLCIRKRC